jgi:hypothetical protein
MGDKFPRERQPNGPTSQPEEASLVGQRPREKAGNPAGIWAAKRALKVLLMPFHGSAENYDFEKAALL